MSEVTVGIIGLIVVLGLFITGIELSFAMIAVGFVGFGYLMSWEAALNLLAKDFFDVFTSYSLTVVPLFILMGQIAFNSGIAKKLFDAAYKYVGHIPGGLAISTVAGATAFKAICGSTPATTATFASVAVPEMERYGYDRRLSSGIVATVGTLGILLPPSVTLIIFGIISDQSIGRLFLAGVFPGLIIAAFFVVVIYGWCRINPAIGPKGPVFSWGARIRVLPEVGWVLVVFLLMVGGIMLGFFTPTEAGSVGTCFVLLLTMLKRDLDVKAYIKSIIEAVRTACMVLLLVTRLDGPRPLHSGHEDTDALRRLDRLPAAQPGHHRRPHSLHLPPGRLFHRRSCLHDPRHADLFPGDRQARLQPYLVQHGYRHHDHDRRSHTTRGGLRLHSEADHEDPDGDDLPRCLSVPHQPGDRGDTSIHLSGVGDVASDEAYGAMI